MPIKVPSKCFESPRLIRLLKYNQITNIALIKIRRNTKFHFLTLKQLVCDFPFFFIGYKYDVTKNLASLKHMYRSG